MQPYHLMKRVRIMIDEKKVEQHYSQGSIIDLILSGIKNMGKTVENITIYDLSPVDEFHIGGLKATQDFINKLNIDSSYHVLDIGCGIGGPSRYTAETFKCKMTGIDLTKEYIEVGNKITEWVSLSEMITLLHASALSTSFENNQFDTAYMMHVGMNIKNKKELTDEIYRVLKPGALFGIYDVMMTSNNNLTYPVPWAENKETSEVNTPEYYKKCLSQSGFSILNEEDKRDFSIEYFENMIKKLKTDNSSPPLGTNILMGDNAKEKIKNAYKNNKSGLMAPHEIISIKA